MGRFVVLFAFLVIFPTIGLAKENQKTNLASNSAIAGTPTVTLWNVNRISGWISNNGMSGRNPEMRGTGVYYPRFVAPVVYQDGLVWGGLVRDGREPALRVGGQYYRVSTAPGGILAVGVPQDPDDPAVRVYRIRRDWRTMSEEVLRLDAAELYGIPPEAVTEEQMAALREQYRLDWEEWPAEAGAPYYDRNGDGGYDPGVDEPGLANADQVIWFVCNDLDSTRTQYAFHSYPLGLELQVTIWGYDDATGPLAQTSFRRYRLINKSGARIDSMYLSQWSDPDVGEYANDLVGCDSLLNLAYVYNGNNEDAQFSPFGVPPAVVGYLLLQGPIVSSPGRKAFFDFRWRPDFQNLPMTSFVPLSPCCLYELDWFPGPVYNCLRGFVPSSSVSHPEPLWHLSGSHEGRATFFPLNGNPVTGEGDIDFPPQDRRLALDSGPFTLAPGDTQEVVLALIGGLQPGGDRFTSLERLKQHARFLKQLYFRGFPEQSLITCESQSSSRETRLRVRMDLSMFTDLTGCRLEFYSQRDPADGFSLTLYDDGQHGDSLAGDGIWGNEITVPNQAFPYDADLILSRASGEERMPALVTDLRLRPLPQLFDWQVVWENGRQDHRVNPGEKVHLAFKIRNPDSLNGIQRIFLVNARNQFALDRPIAPAGTLAVDSLVLVAVAPPQGDSLHLSLTLQFDHHLSRATVALPLYPWSPPEHWGDTLQVQAVKGFPYNVIPIVADPASFTGDRYAVWFSYNQELDTLVWNLTNLTRHEDLLRDQLPGESLEKDFPVIDGIEWNVLSPRPDILAIVEVANRLGPLPPAEWDSVGAPFQGNNVWHSPGAPSDLHPYYISAGGGQGTLGRLIPSLVNANWHDFEIRFTGGENVFLWWYDDDSWTNVPFEAWDVGVGTYHDSTDDVRCLTGGFSGWSTPGEFDFSYTDPALGYPASDWVYLRVPQDSLGTYQQFVQDVTSGTLDYQWWEHSQEVLGRTIFCDYGGSGQLPETGTVIRFITSKPNFPGDSMIVTAPRPSYQGVIPEDFLLTQNFPNPFNSVTTIRFGLPVGERVRLEIFNILGQKVRTLVDRIMEAGTYQVQWDGRNGAGVPQASGVYLYRLTAGKFTRVKKMVLLK